jgi:mRNA-degrading endonuclease toxin of MazEF toxin-antitoxin module
VSGDGSGSISGGGYEAGGARPQTVEIIKTFNQRCPQVIVTNNVQKADFAVTLDHEGGKGNGVLSRALAHKDKVVVFNRDGDAIFSDSTRELGNSVKNACNAILSSPGKK